MIGKVATEAQTTTQNYHHLRTDTSVDFLQKNQADQKTINDTTFIQAGESPYSASSLEVRVEAEVDAVAKEQKTINGKTLVQAGKAPSSASSLEARVQAVVDAVAKESEEEEHLNPDEIYKRMGIKVELQGIIYSL